MQALSLETALQSLLKNFDLRFLQIKRDFFSDILLNERWEGVAFIALFDSNKKILLHTNPELIGETIDYSPLLTENKHKGYYTLKTGEKVFLYENYLPTQNLILRIALHIRPVEESLEYAKKHFYIELTFSIFLLFGGIVAFVFLNKMEKIKGKVEELEKWQLITKVLLHEIKNPLASIKGFAQYIIKKLSNNEFKRPIEIVIRETLRIESLLKTLSHFSYPTKPEIRSCDLKNILEDTIASLKFIHEDIQILVNYDNPNYPLNCDPDKLKSILVNLLDNAIYANLTNKRKNIYVDLKAKERYYILKIKDEGPGIDAKILPRIFEPFFTTKSRGTGLGLAIVKNFCELLGIDIKIESQVGIGTEVWLKIPRF